MANAPSGLSLRLALLILASWIAVGALSGSAVYRSMRRPPAEEAGWEMPDPSPLPSDPSARTVQDDLARAATALHRTAAPTAPGAAGPEDRTDTAQGRDAAPATIGTQTTATASAQREAAERRAAALEADRIAKREKFAAAVSGSAPWASVTPEVMAVLTQQEIASGLEKVEAMPWGPEANRLLQGLLKRWSQLDPRAAAEYALKLDSNRAGGAALRSIFGEWSEQDPSAALDWYLANLRKFPAMLSPSLRTAFMQLAAQDPARALATAWQLPEAMSREALRAVVSQAALEGGLEGLRSVVTGMVPGAQRNSMISAIIQEYSVYQPQEAVNWINMMDDPASRLYAMNQLVSVWGYDKPAEAAQWVGSLGDLNLRGRESVTLIRNWSSIEPDAAAAWLQSMPVAKAMDPAVEQFIRNTMFDDPARAMAFVDRIVDPRRRRSLALSVGKVWYAQNADATRAYFQTSSWDASVRSRFP